MRNRSLPSSAYDQVSGTVTEAAFMDTILQAAELYGWWPYHTHDSRRSNAGFPDLVLIKPPRVLFLEVKSERGRLSRAQAEVLAMLQECGPGDCRYMRDGVEAAMVRPSDWEQIVDWLSWERPE
jgi:hypothetical protein